MAKILVVDDRAENRHFLAKLLGYFTHEVLEAADGSRALDLTRQRHPDLIISDILMPEMDGFDLVRKLRADPDVSKTPVMFYTATYLVSQVQHLAKELGVYFVLEKPSKPQAIINAVNHALELPALSKPQLTEKLFEEHEQLIRSKFSQKLDMAQTRMEALVALNLELSAQTDPRLLLENSCHSARMIIGAKYALLATAANAGAVAGGVFTSGMDAELAAQYRTPEAQAQLAEPIVSPGMTVRERLSERNRPAGLPPASAMLLVPIQSPKQVYGWLCLLDKVGQEEFSAEDERLASILGAQVGRTYENGSLYTELLLGAAELKAEVATRQKAEQSVRESEARLVGTLNSAMDGVISVDIGQRITFFNDAAARMFQLLAAEAIGQPLDRLIPERFRAAHREHVQNFARNAQTSRRMGALGSIIGLRADGTEFPIEASISQSTTGAEKTLTVILRDISERQQLEAQYRQAQKMEAVGRLAGGVAHDFNNLLTIINGYSEMLLAKLHQGDPLRGMVEQIGKAGDRAGGLTRQLLAFSRRQVLMPVLLDLNDLVREMDKMLRRLIGEDIDLMLSLEPQLWHIKADPGQLEQVVMNIVINARDAMPRGGKLTIETSNIELDDTYVAKHQYVKPGQYVMLAISDTGCGMDPAVQARIFEPFFTTKGPEKGTGLGLATAYGIVKQSEGLIEVYSEVGVGTTFKVYLPRCESAAPLSAAPAPSTASLRGSETILLVEDDAGVRELSRALLAERGYRVLEAADGEEALRLAQEHADEIQLLVTDVVMPNMSGPQLAERLALLRPGIKVLYLSGYADEAVVRHGMICPDTPFLQKPYKPESLARKVRHILDGEPVSGRVLPPAIG